MSTSHICHPNISHIHHTYCWMAFSPNTLWMNLKGAMSGRPRGPYTVKKRRPVVGRPYRCQKVYASSSQDFFVAA